MLLSGLAIDIGLPRVEELEGYQDHGLRQSGKIEDSAWFLIALKRLVSIYLNLHLSSFDWNSEILWRVLYKFLTWPFDRF